MNNFDEELIKKYVPKDKIDEALTRYNEGYPVQYIIGNVDFYDCKIDVNENVLIPRFETEYLVDDLLKLLKKCNFNKPNILDIGTGSGCISIALKKNYDANIWAIDISDSAIDTAKSNAKNNNVDITFECIDVALYKSDSKYDVIVSNPPYVAFDEEVDPKCKYEPKNAIFASDNGLFFYKLILEKSIDLLNKKNIIAFEIGRYQAEDIKKIALSYYPNADIIIKKDLSSNDRYVYIINE